jgi:peptidoglycan/xylan/chitin deacetylase (PgdA/CDA1 family)
MFAKLQVDPSIIGKYLYPQLIWESRCKKLLLTFDDGPGPNTENILAALGTAKLRAVFFSSASNAVNSPELVRYISQEGHLIASHSMEHIDLPKFSKTHIENEIATSQKILSEISGQPVRFFRPPYGSFNRHVLRTLKQNNQKCVLWSLLLPDYKNDLNLVKFALRFLKNNSIVVMHDNLKSEKIVLQEISLLIEKARELQFEFGDPLECLK